MSTREITHRPRSKHPIYEPRLAYFKVVSDGRESHSPGVRAPGAKGTDERR